MSSQWLTVVWERSNSTGKWFCYSGEVCQLLEQSLTRNLTAVCLGDVDIELRPYVVNLKDMVQISEETGTKCQVRRLLFDADTAVAQQIAWQWKGDGHSTWNYYSAEIMNFLEAAYKTGQASVNLSEHFQDYPYVINFKKMVQKNRKTKRHRPVSRLTVAAYPVLKVQQDSDKPPNVGNGSACCNHIQEQSLATAGSSPSAGKIPLIKKVSSFWNQLMKGSDSDTENGSTNASTKKKQKPDESPKEDDCSNEFAIVNGKPWKHAWPPSTPASLLKPVPGITPLSEMKGHKKNKKDVGATPTCPVDVFSEFTEECCLNKTDENAEEPVCIICYEALSSGSSYDNDCTLIKLKLCSHIFHKACITAMFNSGPKDNHIQCPTCKTIHGVKHGNQPPGKMVYHVLPYSLPGHSDCDTIRIIYDIPQGIQGAEHPCPGKHYSARGFPRHCYLPDNEMGRKILRLLIKAWDRKLIFTIGASATTGEQNTVTWNEIHHKTEFGCNRRGHGYPDANYFENIIAELAAQGVTESTYAWHPA